MKWEDVIAACKNLGYSPEELLKVMQLWEKAKRFSEEDRHG